MCGPGSAAQPGASRGGAQGAGGKAGWGVGARAVCAWRAHGTIWALLAAREGLFCASGGLGANRIRRGTRRAAHSRSGLGGVWRLCRRALRVVVELSQGCICCPLIVISALVVKNGRAADRMASVSRFCGASCLIAVKQLAFHQTKMTYERGKTRSDDPLRASNQPVWKPKRPPSVRRAYVFDRP